jgi:hypothetical protein
MNQKDIYDNQDELLRKLERVKQELASNPTVLAVGLGFKEINREFTDEISFRVFVAEKKDISELSDQELIPPQIEDIKTDVLTPYLVSDRPNVCGDERETLSKHRPLQAGIAISTDSVSYGTLGWFGMIDADDRRILLTNKHVLYGSTDGTITEKKKTAQPQLGEVTKCCCCECGSDNIIGETIIGIRNMLPLAGTSVDCAIAEINSEHASDISMVITNNSTATVLRVSGTAAAVVGQNVRKIGARSGFTRGIVVHIGDAAVAGTDPLGAAITIRTGQVLIIPTAAETYQVNDRGTCKFAFSNNGDSGSVILNDADEIIALLYGGDEKSNSVDVTFANNINNVLTALSNNSFVITLSTSPAGGGGRSGLHKHGYALKTAEPDRLTAIRDANKSSLLYKLIQEHHQEILDLINNTRGSYGGLAIAIKARLLQQRRRAPPASNIIRPLTRLRGLTGKPCSKKWRRFCQNTPVKPWSTIFQPMDQN